MIPQGQETNLELSQPYTSKRQKVAAPTNEVYHTCMHELPGRVVTEVNYVPNDREKLQFVMVPTTWIIRNNSQAMTVKRFVILPRGSQLSRSNLTGWVFFSCL